MTLDITPWVVFCLGWSFGCLLRLLAEYAAGRQTPPKQLSEWFEE